MISKHIPVTKTARYFILGEPSAAITDLWIACHGYGQLAAFFLQKFEDLNDGKHLVVAPEGLHRFYLDGFHGKIGASWMTKEDREEDIKDYIHFLDDVYADVCAQLPGQGIRITVLGFSQGAATAARWVNEGKVPADRLILWAGAFPQDVDWNSIENKQLKNLKLYLTVGDRDKIVSEEAIQKQEAFLKSNGIDFSFIPFHGGHDIYAEHLKTFI